MAIKKNNQNQKFAVEDINQAIEILSKLFSIIEVAETKLVTSPPDSSNWSFEISPAPITKAKSFCFSFDAGNSNVLSVMKAFLIKKDFTFVPSTSSNLNLVRYLTIYYKN